MNYWKNEQKNKKITKLPPKKRINWNQVVRRKETNPSSLETKTKKSKTIIIFSYCFFLLLTILHEMTINFQKISFKMQITVC